MRPLIASPDEVDMATDLTPTSATSPKLVKKNSLADIRYPFPSMPKTYGCGKCARAWYPMYRTDNDAIDHIKAHVEDNQDETVKKYATIIQTIQKPASIIPHIAKSSSSTCLDLKPKYLCFHCSHIAAYDDRDSHEKEHTLCKECTTGDCKGACSHISQV